MIRAELIWTADRRPDSVELGRALAEHLELSDDDSEIALFLSDPGHLVEQRGLTQGELEERADCSEAAGTLQKRRRPQSPGPTGAHAALDPLTWQAPTDNEQLPSPTPDRPTKDYVDPSNVGFGTPEPVAPRPPPGLPLGRHGTMGAAVRRRRPPSCRVRSRRPRPMSSQQPPAESAPRKRPSRSSSAMVKGSRG